MSEKFIFFKELQNDHYKYRNVIYVCDLPDYFLQIKKDYGGFYFPEIFCKKTNERHYFYNITNDPRKKNYPKTLKEAKQRIFDWIKTY